MRVITTDSFVGRKPDDFLRIDKDTKDVIRTERAAGTFESEMLGWLPILEAKSAAAVAGDPDIIARPAHNRSHRTRGSVGFHRLKQVFIVKDTALFGTHSRAGPKTAVRIDFERIDKVAARFARDFPGLTVFDHHHAAALRSGVEFFAHQRQTRDLQGSGMILVHA